MKIQAKVERLPLAYSYCLLKNKEDPFSLSHTHTHTQARFSKALEDQMVARAP
jgi:hypothetical protein